VTPDRSGGPIASSVTRGLAAAVCTAHFMVRAGGQRAISSSSIQIDKFLGSAFGAIEAAAGAAGRKGCGI